MSPQELIWYDPDLHSPDKETRVQALKHWNAHLVWEPVSELQEPVWEQQPGETDKEYQKFVIFARLAPGERSLVRAWQDWRGKRTPASSHFRAGASRWRWVERALARDAEQIRQAQLSWLEKDLKRREDDFRDGDFARIMARRALEAQDPEQLEPGMALRLLELASRLQGQAVPRPEFLQSALDRVFGKMGPERIARLSVLLAEASR